MQALTTNELSRESVYQQSLLEWNGTPSNSGRKIDTKFFMASMAWSGNVEHFSAGRGTDH
jgi:hypothetical protein